jgi:hypothetical protein
MTAQPGLYSSGMVGSLDVSEWNRAAGEDGQGIRGRWKLDSEWVML